jgi:hypothetical protein
MRELPLPDRILTAFLFRPQAFQHHFVVEPVIAILSIFDSCSFDPPSFPSVLQNYAPSIPGPFGPCAGLIMKRASFFTPIWRSALPCPYPGGRRQ